MFETFDPFSESLATETGFRFDFMDSSKLEFTSRHSFDVISRDKYTIIDVFIETYENDIVNMSNENIQQILNIFKNVTNIL